MFSILSKNSDKKKLFAVLMCFFTIQHSLLESFMGGFIWDTLLWRNKCSSGPIT